MLKRFDMTHSIGVVRSDVPYVQICLHDDDYCNVEKFLVSPFGPISSPQFLKIVFSMNCSMNAKPIN